MNDIENKPDEPPVATEKKANLGAKIGVAFALGSFIGGKLIIPGTMMDLNNIFPEGTPLAAKFKQTLSKEVIPLIKKAVVKQMQENGYSPKMATLAAMKWSLILPAVGGVVLGTIGWKRADRIENSSDIIKHPIKSTKIIFGLQEPDSKPAAAPKEIKGKHTETVLAKQPNSPEIALER